MCWLWGSGPRSYLSLEPLWGNGRKHWMQRVGAPGFSKLVILGYWLSKWRLSLFIKMHKPWFFPSLTGRGTPVWQGKGDRDVFGKRFPGENNYSIRLWDYSEQLTLPACTIAERKHLSPYPWLFWLVVLFLLNWIQLLYSQSRVLITRGLEWKTEIYRCPKLDSLLNKTHLAKFLTISLFPSILSSLSPSTHGIPCSDKNSNNAWKIAQ